MSNIIYWIFGNKGPKYAGLGSTHCIFILVPQQQLPQPQQQQTQQQPANNNAAAAAR